MKHIQGGKMKGQIFELLFYPYLAILLLLFFSFASNQIISEINIFKVILTSSDGAVEASNLLILNRSLDHVFDELPLLMKEKYMIKRLILHVGERDLTVKELIFPYVK